MAKKRRISVVVIMVLTIFLVSISIIALTYVMIARDLRGPGVSATEAGTQGTGSTSMDPPSSYPLSLLPDPGEAPHAQTSTPEQNSTPGKTTGKNGLSGSKPNVVMNDDDGELHDGWNDSVSYTLKEERFEQHAIEEMPAYGLVISQDFDIAYPQLVNAGPHTDELNVVLRDTAMRFYNRYVANPEEELIAIVRDGVEISQLGVPEGADAMLSSNVTWAVTYNTDDFISVSFSDSYFVGSYAGEYVALRTVNANLKTGEVYQLDDVLTVTDAVAKRFMDVFYDAVAEDYDGDGKISSDEVFSVSIIGRDAWEQAIKGEGDYAERVAPTFFVDEKGRVNLGVTYWLGNERGISRGWWDATLTDKQLEGAKKDSSFWSLLGDEASSG